MLPFEGLNEAIRIICTTNDSNKSFYRLQLFMRSVYKVSNLGNVNIISPPFKVDGDSARDSLNNRLQNFLSKFGREEK